MMWNCPICAAGHTSGGICKKCGFDQSRNYEQNMTLCFTLPKDQKPIAVRAKEWRQKQTATQIHEALICPVCSSAQFYFSKGDREFVCVECGKKTPLSDAVTVGASPQGRLAFRSSVAAGSGHTVALKADGTVIAVGENRCGQCNVGEWTDIAAVAAGGGLHGRIAHGRHSDHHRRCIWLSYPVPLDGYCSHCRCRQHHSGSKIRRHSHQVQVWDDRDD